MPRTLEQAFALFHERLSPKKHESRLALRHRVSIRRSLQKEFDIQTFSQCGSFGNGTSIAGHSDADYLAWLPASLVPSNSKTMLREVCAGLKRAFPRTKGLCTNSPAIKVPFGKIASETTEVVPAKKCGQTPAGFAVYKIADGKGGWLKTSPNAHNAAIKAQDILLHKRLKPLVCFLKAWKYHNKVPVSSFYLEMCAARYMKPKSKVVYERDLAGFFAHLDKNLSDVRDPTGISGLIKPCCSLAKADTTRSKIKTAASRSQKALDACSKGNVREAFKYWRLLFGPRFPSIDG